MSSRPLCLVVFLVDTRLCSDSVSKSHSLHGYRNGRSFIVRNCLADTTSVVDRLAWYILKCYDYQRLKKRLFPQPISRGNLLCGREWSEQDKSVHFYPYNNNACWLNINSLITVYQVKYNHLSYGIYRYTKQNTASGLVISMLVVPVV